MENQEGNIKVIGVANCLVKHFQLPEDFLANVIRGWFNGCEKHKDNLSELSTKLKVIGTFMTNVIENGQFDPKLKYNVWQEFGTKYDTIKGIQELFKLLQKVGTK